MPSPFPGLDPYVESAGLWPDFHLSFIAALRDVLVPAVRPRYLVCLDERVTITYDDDAVAARTVRPDVAVVEPGDSSAAPVATAVATANPVLVPIVMPIDWREPFLEIREADSGKLVTALEILSPANKTPNSKGRRTYVQKRESLIASDVHLVELDFLRGGQRMPMAGPLPAGDAYAIVSREDRRPTTEVYALRLADRLPTIPIPLRAPDPDAAADLQGIFQDVYDRAQLQRRINYAKPLRPPLDADQAAFVERVLREAGKVGAGTAFAGQRDPV